MPVLATGIAAMCLSALSSAFIGKRLGTDGKMYLAEANAALLGCVSVMGMASAVGRLSMLSMSISMSRAYPAGQCTWADGQGMGVSAMIISYTPEAFFATT